MTSAVTGPIPGSACSVPSLTRRSSSLAGRLATTAAARRNACTRYVGAPARSSRNAICRNARSGSTPRVYPSPRKTDRARSNGPVMACPVGLAQGALEHLAGSAPRQVFDDVDRGRALVVRQAVAAEGDDVGGGELRARGRDDDGLDGLAPVLVGDADDHAVAHARAGVEHALDLGAVHVLAAGDDHVLEPVQDIHEALGVRAADVAAADPAVGGLRLRGGLGPVEIAAHRLDGPEPDLPCHPRLDVIERHGV